MIGWMLFAALMVTRAPSAPASVVAEDFATYADGLLPADRWEVGGLGWIVRGGRLHCEAGSRSTAWPSAAPSSRNLTS